jgi:hypothetical protein
MELSSQTQKCLEENGGKHKEFVSGTTKFKCNSCGWSVKRRYWIIELLPSILWVPIIKFLDK